MPPEEPLPDAFRCETVYDDGDRKRIVFRHTNIPNFKISITASSGVDTLPDNYGDFKAGNLYDTDLNPLP